MHPLTEEQRIFAEKHHDFIYQYLNGRHLNIEDYYDTAVFGYLEAVQDYLEKTGETTTNTAVRTETYENAEVLTGQIIQNLNYIQGNIKLTQKDEAYRKFVDDAKALTQKYQKLLQDAQDAQGKVEDAQGKVEELKAEIEALKSNRTSNLGALEELEGKLTVAEQNKKDAEDTLKEILDSLDEAGGELDKAIERLTPAPTPGTPAGGEGETRGCW